MKPDQRGEHPASRCHTGTSNHRNSAGQLVWLINVTALSLSLSFWSIWNNRKRSVNILCPYIHFKPSSQLGAVPFWWFGPYVTHIYATQQSSTRRLLNLHKASHEVHSEGQLVQKTEWWCITNIQLWPPSYSEHIQTISDRLICQKL